jgi:predicted outer membrane repeat protein
MKNCKHFTLIGIAAIIVFGFGFIACDNDNGNRNDNEKTFIVTFNADNGTENKTQTVNKGDTVNEPSNTTKVNDVAGLFAGTPPAFYTLDGWYNDVTKWDFSNDTVTENITLIAKWTAPTTIDLTGTSGNNIVEKTVSYINTNSGSEYTLLLGTDISNVEPQTLDQDNTTLNITSNGMTERKIMQGSIGSLFIVGGKVDLSSSTKLVIDGNVTLIGRQDNNSLIQVLYGGTLELKGNAKVTGNTSTLYFGGGIYAEGGDGYDVNITMSGNAEISGNFGNYSLGGGGVWLSDYATLTMSENAKIKNNISRGSGGGVYVREISSVFIMNGGEISYNTAGSNGGGVRVQSGTFIVANEQVLAYIHSNTADGDGPQVYKLPDRATFTVDGQPAESF